MAEIADICVARRLAKVEYLFHDRDAALGFYVVQSGAISVQRVTPDGREPVIHVFRPFASFAVAAASPSPFDLLRFFSSRGSHSAG